ncbi:MAG: UPF0175 family protein [Anaerolineae bacterium]
MARSVSRTDLARRTREVLEMARQQSVVLVESFGEEQVAVVDALDYRLLKALARCGTRPLDRPQHATGLDESEIRQAIAAAGGDTQAGWDLAVAAFLDGSISLGRAATLLGLSRFDLARRLNRVGAPVPQAPQRADEARDDLAALER